MERNLRLTYLALVLLFGSAIGSQAQVKQIQMHIDGYLCGN
jgi:hypothetical protein